MRAYGDLDDARGGLGHHALLYGDDQEWVAGVGHFVAPALDAGERVIVMVGPDRHELLRTHLGSAADAFQVLEIGEIARNPARLIPYYSGLLADARGTVHLVGELAWPGRAVDELVEVMIHEALVNLALADREVRSLCAYDTARLAPEVIESARRTHPYLLDCTGVHTRGGYVDGGDVSAWQRPLSEVPVGADGLEFTCSDLRRVRRLTSERALAEGLRPDAREDLVVAVNELATNSLRHAGGHGKLRIWATDEALLCEISDGGQIVDPLAGRRLPDACATGGRGLWLVNQLCELVQIRSDERGTRIRLSAALAPR